MDKLDLKVSEDGILVLIMIWGNEWCGCMGKGRRELPSPAASATYSGLSFCVTNGKREKKVSLAGLSIPGICSQGTMTNEGANRNGPRQLHAQQALSDYGQYRKRSNAKSSTAVSPSQLFTGGIDRKRKSKQPYSATLSTVGLGVV